MNLMEQFADSQLIESLSLGEKLTGAGITTIMGMGITFMVLAFLWGAINLMARLISQSDRCFGSRESIHDAPEHGLDEPNFRKITEDDAPEHAVAVVIAGAIAEHTNNAAGFETPILCNVKRMQSRPVWAYPIRERKVCR